MAPKNKLCETFDKILALARRILGEQKHNESDFNHLSAHIATLKEALSGPNSNELAAPLAPKLYDGRALLDLIILPTLSILKFEARKMLVSLLILILHSRGPLSGPPLPELGPSPLRTCLDRNPEILDTLLRSYVPPHSYTQSATQILKEFLRQEDVALLILEKCHEEQFSRLFHAMDDTNFDVSSDASTVVKELFTRYRNHGSEYIQRNPDFIRWYETLLNSKNYSTRLFSLTLLGQLLFSREYYNVMIQYVGSQDNLKLVMCLMKDNGHQMRIAAFNVFKIFVANPQKPEGILKILRRNRDKLMEFLSGLELDRDEQLKADLQDVLAELSQLGEIK
ncbi:putative Mo25-like protein [Giardia muris]|uniref:Putative Mo25-like protein n=1 Tax=Giardia muris TaxID=5742 RepID=A0A4Z1T2L3_GIAMU|nr:putative Mo25-like protein [Giardia muris]|eukprot:TNJ28183.1 putative Mo25-like protein [Giardia muris]